MSECVPFAPILWPNKLNGMPDPVRRRNRKCFCTFFSILAKGKESIRSTVHDPPSLHIFWLRFEICSLKIENIPVPWTGQFGCTRSLNYCFALILYSEQIFCFSFLFTWLTTLSAEMVHSNKSIETIPNGQCPGDVLFEQYKQQKSRMQMYAEHKCTGLYGPGSTLMAIHFIALA